MGRKDGVKRSVVRLSESGGGFVLHSHLFLSNNGLSPQACPIGIPTWIGVMERSFARPFEPVVRSKYACRQIANTQDVRLNVQ